MGRVSLVVTTRNHLEVLGANLRHHLAYLPRGGSAANVIVVDNASTDGTPDWMAARHPDVTLIRLSTDKGTFGLNIGVAVASTRYVACSDESTWWRPGALDLAADHLDRYPNTGVVLGATSAFVGRRDIFLGGGTSSGPALADVAAAGWALAYLPDLVAPRLTDDRFPSDQAIGAGCLAAPLADAEVTG